jgi:YggT family protein
MISSILVGLAAVINIVLSLVQILVFISVGLSWFSADPYNPYVQMVRGLTEPMYKPFRRWTSKISGPIDISPILVILIIVFLQKSLPTYLMSLSNGLR